MSTTTASSRPVASTAAGTIGAAGSTTVSASPNEPAKPMRKDAARNRELLLSSARVVFAQRGVDACLDDIAHHAGLGVGTAYRHFPNKYELLSALMDQIVDTFIVTAEAALAIDEPWTALVSFLENALEVQVNDRGLREVLLGFHDPAKFDQVHERVGAVLTELLEHARAAGVVRPDIQPSDVAVIITMLCSVADMTGDDHPDVWRRYLAMCLEGLKPGAAPLPEAPLSDAQFRDSMIAYKQAQSGRATGC